ncbi:MAG: 16S rRNA (adenine(1518)-N(6)/adenine(1519)-N(6))-dimethyltransferase RsmA [Bacteroides sp.]|jgi:16S rRNA (adenine1518-N6/adenine1519-N6)-dimethyltransferase|nr:16S rRNA (adenine(1518)-N(6)/adenine(1519)-N(6))-dimethyltransferase RsmA [Bacteroides sp.]
MPQPVRPKKFLGQHFLRDENIARKIAGSLTGFGKYKKILEIGPGTGVLTKFLIHHEEYQWHGVEIDRDSIAHLKEHFPAIADRLMEADFLHMSLPGIAKGEPFAIIGNFPYNISSQIVFKVLEHRDLVPELVGMFQKEMGQRIAAPSGNKTYGILSVLTQAFYRVEYLFQVDEHVFHPPPKVKSAVIRMQRKDEALPCEARKLFIVVKAAFNQRRKTLHNSLRGVNINWEALPADFAGRRPEQMNLEDFLLLAQQAGEGGQ